MERWTIRYVAAFAAIAGVAVGIGIGFAIASLSGQEAVWRLRLRHYIPYRDARPSDDRDDEMSD